MSEEAVGNQLADKAAKEAAVSQATLLAPLVQVDLNDYKPVYTPQEIKVATEQLKATLNRGWYMLPNNHPYVPENCAWPLVRSVHEAIHLGKGALADLISKKAYVNHLHARTNTAVRRCVITPDGALFSLWDSNLSEIHHSKV